MINGEDIPYFPDSHREAKDLIDVSLSGLKDEIQKKEKKEKEALNNGRRRRR